MVVRTDNLVFSIIGKATLPKTGYITLKLQAWKRLNQHFVDISALGLWRCAGTATATVIARATPGED